MRREYWLEAVPKVVCVKEAVEFGVEVDDIDAALCGIPNDGTGEVASVLVLLGIDSQAAIDAQFQSVFSCQLHFLSSRA